MRLLKHILRVLLTGSAFVIFFTGGALLAWLRLPLARLLRRDPMEKNRACLDKVGADFVFFHNYMRVLGLIDFDPRTSRFAIPDGPFVMVANHPSLIDMTALQSMHHRLLVVAKHAMFKSPLVGRLLKACWHIDAGSGDIFSGGAVIRAAEERLAAGFPVLIFPEGTRSPERGLGRFRQGAFDVAARAKVPILPVFITMDPPTLMRGVPWYVIPPHTATMRVSALPLIDTAGADPAVLCQQTEERFRTLVQDFYSTRPAQPADQQKVLRPTGTG